MKQKIRKIIKGYQITTSILVSVLVLGSTLMGLHLTYLSTVVDDIVNNNYALVTKWESSEESLESVLSENEKLKRENAELLEKMEIIVAFRQAGIANHELSIEDVRELLELTNSVPYGSPFASGHWVSSPFGLRDESQIKGNNYTEGIDLVGKHGDRIARTTADGVIIDFGYSDVYGKYIVVEHPGGFRTKYSHLSKIFYQDEAGNVKGVQLHKGDKIGVMGNTGRCFSENGGDGSHLDYRIFIKKALDKETIWKPLNPTAILAYTGGEYLQEYN